MDKPHIIDKPVLPHVVVVHRGDQGGCGDSRCAAGLSLLTKGKEVICRGVLLMHSEGDSCAEYTGSRRVWPFVVGVLCG